MGFQITAFYLVSESVIGLKAAFHSIQSLSFYTRLCVASELCGSMVMVVMASAHSCPLCVCACVCVSDST